MTQEGTDTLLTVFLNYLYQNLTLNGGVELKKQTLNVVIAKKCTPNMEKRRRHPGLKIRPFFYASIINSDA